MRVLFLFTTVLLFSCSQENKGTIIDSTTADSLSHPVANKMHFRMKVVYFIPTAAELDSIEKISAPVKGYRFVITGDFDGDGKQEILTEHYYSKKLTRETNKYYDSLEYYDLVGFTIQKEPWSFLTCSNRKIDTLNISDALQQLGISFMKNEGDLNGDGNDEISYVVNCADFSNLNTCYIKTWKNGKWKELYSFSVWDWQFPAIPQTYTQYGLFGTEAQFAYTGNDSLLCAQEYEFNHFPGLIKKMRNGRTRIEYMGEGAELDTMYVRMDTIKFK